MNKKRRKKKKVMKRKMVIGEVEIEYKEVNLPVRKRHVERVEG